MALKTPKSKTKTYSDDVFTLTLQSQSDLPQWGDAETLRSGMVGGLDTFHGSSPTDATTAALANVAVGDAITMRGTAKGGADQFYGGDFATNNFFGDATQMTDFASGGADTLEGGENGVNTLAGDASTMLFKSSGGSDHLVGGDAMFGFANSVDISGSVEATTALYPVIEGASENYLYGDAQTMAGSTRGGNDVITGGSARGITLALSIIAITDSGADPTDVENVIFGEGESMLGNAIGGADTLIGGSALGRHARVTNTMYGDASSMTENTRGGNDSLTGGGADSGDWFDPESPTASDYAYVVNKMYGDANQGQAIFGSDTLQGGAGVAGTTSSVENYMYGDILGPLLSQGGNDRLYGGESLATNQMYGDAYEIGVGGIGGDDLLLGGGFFTSNFMVGDACSMTGATGGNDRLVSGDGFDTMYGDAFELKDEASGGADTFVFAPENSRDRIEDFRLDDRDKVDLSAFRLLSSDFGSVEALIASGRITAQDGDLFIDTDPGDSFASAGDDNHVVISGGVGLLESASSWLIL